MSSSTLEGERRTASDPPRSSGAPASGEGIGAPDQLTGATWRQAAWPTGGGPSVFIPRSKVVGVPDDGARTVAFATTYGRMRPPPSTTRVWPVTRSAPSMKLSTAWAMSSGVQTRARGVPCATRSLSAS